MTARAPGWPPHVVAVVCEAETTLGAVLPRLGAGAEIALADGRVFVGVHRALHAEELVRRGDEVIVYPARVAVGESARILLARDGLIAAYKPAAIATIADQRGRTGTLIDEVARLTGVHRERLHPSSRLDVGVSGVVLFAADEPTRVELARARELGAYARHYVAIASSTPSASAGEWTAPIGRDRDPRRRRVGGTRAAAAHSSYAVVATLERAALLALEPRTGRTHQLRVHAAHAGCALWGDAAYGGPVRLVSPRGVVQLLSRVMLHAAWVEVPCHGAAVRVEAPLPDELGALWTALGGEPTHWDGAWSALPRPRGPS